MNQQPTPVSDALPGEAEGREVPCVVKHTAPPQPVSWGSATVYPLWDRNPEMDYNSRKEKKIIVKCLCVRRIAHPSLGPRHAALSEGPTRPGSARPAALRTPLPGLDSPSQGETSSRAVVRVYTNPDVHLSCTRGFSSCTSRHGRAPIPPHPFAD